mgnify:CR=1 FL=1
MGEEKGTPTELNFPIDFSSCPNCGSTEKLADLLMKEQIKQGKVRPEVKGALIIYQLPITDPTKQSFSFPVLTAVVDVCVKCGTLYCIHAEYQTTYKGISTPPSKFNLS